MTFGKAFLASALANFLMGLLLLLVFFMILGGILSSAFSGAGQGSQVMVKNHTVLKIDLSGSYSESAEPIPFDLPEEIPFFADLDKGGLYEFRKALKDAKDDSRVDGILIEPGFTQDIGWASLQNLREALMDFKSSGKFIYAYAEVYTEKSYYIASLADSIYLHPQGAMELNGLASTPMFFTGTMEKLDIHPVVFKKGKYKSAVEPYFLKKMSEPAREQMSAFLGDMWATFAADVAASRKMDVAQLNALTDSMTVRRAADAVNAKLVDRTETKDYILNLLKQKTSASSTKNIPLMNLRKYVRATKHYTAKEKSAGKLALIIAEGAIMDGSSTDGVIGSVTLAEAIRKAREDSTIKAVVMRVNSPGGSALASDVIAREVQLTSEVKPFIVSMGDVAASGGYYISAYADKIFAHRNTITGSIGVLGVMMNLEKFMENKLGITSDVVKTHSHADFMNPMMPVNEWDSAVVMQSIDDVYNTFTSVVSKGRNIPQPTVDSLGQGHVYSGEDALAIGLVDTLGGLEDAMAYAAKQAGLGDNYKLKILPEKKDPFSQMFGGALQALAEGQTIAPEIMEQMREARKQVNAFSKSGIYTVMEYNYEIK